MRPHGAAPKVEQKLPQTFNSAAWAPSSFGFFFAGVSSILLPESKAPEPVGGCTGLDATGLLE
eukprot:9328927-Lingulodinium_polyedra.AAC.1